MKNILAYGDSNTWGQVPLRDATKRRHPIEVRWTGRMQSLLGPDYRVIEEGNNGRTTGLEDPARAGRDGLAHLSACLDSHVPLDLVILMLGTIDLKRKFSPTPAAITERLGELVRTVRRITAEAPGGEARILIVAPLIIRPDRYYGDDFTYSEAETYSRALAPLYATLSEREGTGFFDAGSIVRAGEEDGTHFDAENHARLAEALAESVRRELGKS